MMTRVLFLVLLLFLLAEGKRRRGGKSKGNVCNLPPVKGFCRGLLTRYYYDSESQSCKTFRYGGCRGNRNRFKSEKKCMKTCGPKPKPKPKPKPQPKPEPKDVCSLEKDTGNCRGMHNRYYFDKESNTCKVFKWGGCGGNGNRFKKEKQCLKTCQKVDRCTLPAKTGFCKGLFERFHYDSKTKSCKKFNYGGCNGNDNRFFSKEKCMHACGGGPAPACKDHFDGKTCKIAKENGKCKNEYMQERCCKTCSSA